MKIYNINQMMFKAKVPTVKKVNSEMLPEKFTKKDFYDQIDGFLKNKYGKDEYLKKFFKGLDKIIEQKSAEEYTLLERQYIHKLESLVDMSEDINSVPDSYFKKNMQELLKYKK